MQKYYGGGGENAQETEEERRFTRILIQSATFASTGCLGIKSRFIRSIEMISKQRSKVVLRYSIFSF